MELHGGLQVSDNKDASLSTRNSGIDAEFLSGI